MDGLDRRDAIFLALLFALPLALSAVALQGGVLHSELYRYMPLHLSNLPLGKIIFDSNVLQLGTYRGRELSLLLDHFDHRFISFSVRHGWPHFYSAFFFLAVFLTGALVWRLCVGGLRLDRPSTAGLVLLFWTSPFVVLGGSCFHTAKAGVALVVALYLATVRGPGQEDSARAQSLTVLLWCSALGLLGALLDEQGLALMALFAALAALEYALDRDPRRLARAAGLGSGLLLGAVCNRYLGPLLTRHFLGYDPNFAQRGVAPVPPGIEGQPMSLFQRGAVLFVDTFRFLCGNIPAFLAILLLGGLCWVLRRRQESGPEHVPAPRPPRILRADDPVLLLLPVILMYSAMLAMHAPLWWPDVRRVYYGLPTAVLLVFLLARGVDIVRRERFLPPWAVTAVLFLLGLANIRALPRHLAVQHQGHMTHRYEWSRILLGELRHLDTPLDKVDPQVRQDAIYQLFRGTAAPRDQG